MEVWITLCLNIWISSELSTSLQLFESYNFLKIFAFPDTNPILLLLQSNYSTKMGPTVISPHELFLTGIVSDALFSSSIIIWVILLGINFTTRVCPHNCGGIFLRIICISRNISLYFLESYFSGIVSDAFSCSPLVVLLSPPFPNSWIIRPLFPQLIPPYATHYVQR